MNQRGRIPCSQNSGFQSLQMPDRKYICNHSSVQVKESQPQTTTKHNCKLILN